MSNPSNGNSISYVYTSGQLSSITDTQGRVTTLNYTSGKLSSLVDSTGRTTGFTYNANGNLATSTNADNKVTTYSYDLTFPWLLTKITDPFGNPRWLRAHVGQMT
jgi:YD repeat-containing protein